MTNNQKGDGGTSLFEKASSILDRINYSHAWNRKYFEAESERLSKHADNFANIKVQMISWYRSNLLALVGWLVALIGLLVNNWLVTNSLSFQIGFIGLLLSVTFATIQSIVVAYYDMADIQRTLDEVMIFKGVVWGYLMKVKRTEFWKKDKEAFDDAIKRYSTYLQSLKRGWTARVSGIVWALLNISLLVGLIWLSIHFGSLTIG